MTSRSDIEDRIFGRDRELAELNAALDRAIDSNTQLILLVGEPGIGKTRLAEETASLAQKRGARVAWGHCLDGGGAPPYWPWTQVLESLSRQVGPTELQVAAGNSRSVLALLLPEFGVAGESSTQDGFTLHRAIMDTIVELSNSSPIVLIIEDMQWADDASLQALKLMATTARDARVMLVGTFRNTDVSRTHPLSAILPALNRIPGASRVRLSGLDETSVAMMLGQHAERGDPGSGVSTREVASRTDGNPFFVREVALSLRSESLHGSRSPIPEGIIEAVGRRLSDLDQGSLDVLRIGSLIGREFDAELVSDVSSELSIEECLESCETIVARGFVRESESWPLAYTFVHSLLQETIAAELSASRRIRLHGRIGEALERRYGSDDDRHTGELARHFVEAEVILGPDKGIEYSIKAARNALQMDANDDADRYTSRGLEIAGGEHSGFGELLSLRAEALGSTLSRSYSNQDRWDAVVAAFQHYESSGDTERASEVVMLGSFLANVEGAASLLKRALGMVPDSSPKWPWLALRYGVALDGDLGNTDAAAALFRTVADQAEHAGDHQLLGRALAHLCQACLGVGDHESAVKHGVRAVQLGIATGDIGTPGRLSNFLSDAYLALGLVAQSEAALATIETLDLYPYARATIYTSRTLLTLASGNWRLADESHSAATELMGAASQLGTEVSGSRLFRGATDGSVDWFLDELHRVTGDDKVGRIWGTFYAGCAALAADVNDDERLLSYAENGLRGTRQQHPMTHRFITICGAPLDCLITKVTGDAVQFIEEPVNRPVGRPAK